MSHIALSLSALALSKGIPFWVGFLDLVAVVLPKNWQEDDDGMLHAGGSGIQEEIETALADATFNILGTEFHPRIFTYIYFIDLITRGRGIMMPCN